MIRRAESSNEAPTYGHPIPENSFAVRDLAHELPGVGSEEGREHCHWCGLPLPEDGDPAVTRTPVMDESGCWEQVPLRRRHWRDAALQQGEADNDGPSR